MVKIILFLALIATLLIVCSTASTTDWWEDASLYQIYPRSWKDSDGNGIGDLKGITEKLEYLREIGITATWLSPIFQSPMADNGYDISNFTEIDPIFGTLEDFDNFLKKAKTIGLKIILDFVPNHSSDECEWFIKSVNREDGYDDFYVWDDGLDDPKNPGKKLPPSNWISIFEGSMWEWNEKRQQFYLHQFLKEQPDFNFRNPKVHKAMLDVLKFWLDRGVDGFRIDAVTHMYEKVFENGTYPDEPLSGLTNDSNSQHYVKHIYTQEQYETVELLYEWREFLDNYKKEHGGDTRILLAEAYVSIETIGKYFGNGTHFGAHLPFNFNFETVNMTSNARDVEETVSAWMDIMWKNHKMANWVAGNHDLQRIGERVGHERKDLVNVVLAALPGATITYYGEEIGMDAVKHECPNVCSEKDVRDFSRSPFQWNDQVSAGFSTSPQTWLAVADNYKKVNVKVQRGIARSTLNVFKSSQKLKHTAAFKAAKDEGGFSYGAVNDNVFQIIRGHSTEQYRIFANFGDKLENIGELLGTTVDGQNLFEYALVTSYSPHKIGERIKLSELLMMPFEANILKKVI